MKQTLTQNCESTSPNTEKNLFIIYASAIGLGTVHVQADDRGQMQIITYTSRNFTKSEQKLAMICRELTAIVYAVENYELLIIGSKHPIRVLTDHISILSQFDRESNIYPQFPGTKLLLHVFQNFFFLDAGTYTLLS